MYTLENSPSDFVILLPYLAALVDLFPSTSFVLLVLTYSCRFYSLSSALYLEWTTSINRGLSLHLGRLVLLIAGQLEGSLLADFVEQPWDSFHGGVACLKELLDGAIT